VDVTELRSRANAEVLELGPVPGNPRDHEIWVAERRGAIVLLAGLADSNRQLLRSAANGDWVSIATRSLLLHAAQECYQAVSLTRCSISITPGPGL